MSTFTIYDNTRADCDLFAAKFARTCDGTSLATNVALMEGTDVTCTSTGPNCVDSRIDQTDNGDGTVSCTYTRKLCVICTSDAIDTDEDVRLNVQSNGLPQNCFYGKYQLVEQNIDFSVAWNSLTTENYVKESIKQGSDPQYTNEVCTVDNKQNTDAGVISVTSGAYDMEAAIGVSLDGVLLFPGVERNEFGAYVDPFYNADFDNISDATGLDEIVIDGCYGTVNSDGVYFYRTATNCIETQTVTQGFGITVADLREDGMKGRIDVLKVEYLGIAKDGRVIYGPRKDTDTTRQFSPCELDICNGYKKQVSGNYIYSYRATKFHPYLAGCFGPGSEHDEGISAQYCSTNPSKCGAIDGIVASTLVLLASLSWLFN